MKSKKYSPEQISEILREYEQGKSVLDISREHKISPATFYKWQERYKGIEPSDLKKLKALEEEEENRQQKKIYSELAFNHELAKGIVD